MKRLLRSVVTAGLIAVAVQCFAIGVLAPNLPRMVGRPDVEVERVLTLPAAKTLCLNNQDGSVQVRAQAVDKINVQARIMAYGRHAADVEVARIYVDSLIRAETDGAVLRITTEPQERPDPIDLRVNYDILVPVGTDIRVEGSNGNVWISKDCGCVSVLGRNADIDITEPRGAVLAQSTNGRIRIVDAPDGATIQTVNGNVYAHMLGGSLRAATTNGAIVARVLDPRVEACTLSSQNGGITLVMADECSASVEAVTDRGTIRSDLPLDATGEEPKRKHLQGTIGAGHTKVNMDTLNGNIWIARETL